MLLKVIIYYRRQVGLVRNGWGGWWDSSGFLFFFKKGKNPEVLGWTNL